MYNVKAAVSRLPAGPESDRMEVTDVETGHFVFPPVPNESLRRDSLYWTLKRAGYEMTEAWLAATGRVTKKGRLEALESGQPFVLTDGPALERLRRATAAGNTVSVHGVWTAGAGADTVAVERWAKGTEIPDAKGVP